MTTIAQPKGAWRRPRFARPAWLTGAVRRLRTGWGWLVARSAPLRGIVLSLVRPLRVVTELGWLAACLGVSTLVAGVLLGWAEAIAIGVIFLVCLAVATLWMIGQVAYAATIEVDATRVKVGDHVLGRLLITNQGRRGLTSTVVELPVGRGAASFLVPPLGAGKNHEQMFTVPTRRRAVITIGPARSVKADPLGLLRRERSWSESVEIFVHPRTVLVDADTTGLLRDIEGVVTRDLSSSDVAFHALRDYVPGDDRRAVHWRSTARTGRLIVRQFEETRKTHLLVVLSLDASEYATEDEFELAISAAGSLVLQASREDRRASLISQAGLVQPRSPGLLLDELCWLESAPGKTALPRLTSAAVTQVPDATVAALISGSLVEPKELARARANVPNEIRTFAIRCDQASDPGFRRVGSMNVLTIAELGDLPKGAGNL